MTSLAIGCLCGAIAQTVTLRSASPEGKITPLTLCHCTICRHTSGVLCTSYCPIEPVAATTSADLTAYSSSPGTTRFFCSSCGCHVFRSHHSKGSPVRWEVATGVIISESQDNKLAYTRHDHVADTSDGGLAIWMPTVGDHAMAGSVVTPAASKEGASKPANAGTGRTIAGSCHCGNVRFTIRAPEVDLDASRRPRSDFADLLVPYATSARSVASNPGDEKWWLRAGASGGDTQTRYLAGTCACRSCRLATGFEIQTWTFVPRANIFMADQAPNSLDFASKHTLATYASSPGVERNFCPRCGATVFWHDVWRSELIDVSVGLLADDTSRAESMLDWCTTRVSFAEESIRGRRGVTAQRAAQLIDSLEAGMKVFNDSRKS